MISIQSNSSPIKSKWMIIWTVSKIEIVNELLIIIKLNQLIKWNLESKWWILFDQHSKSNNEFNSTRMKIIEKSNLFHFLIYLIGLTRNNKF